MTNFTDLGLAAPLLKALNEEGYVTPTPIQAKAIPVVMTGTDLLGIAQTGTGKTAAFALPILHRLQANRRPAMAKGCRVLVLSPTRELATQIAESFKTYGRHMGISVAIVFGGMGHRPQRLAMARGVDVLVATPGRLIDHIEERTIVLSGTEILVLDEADQMLDQGFIRPIRQIVGQLSQRRQSLLFSATMPAEIGKLADEMLREPTKVSVAPASTTIERVTQKVIHIEAAKKRALLVELLADPALSRVLVFTRTKRGADRVAAHLEAANISVAAIHGNKSQNQREAALESFRSAVTRVLVATDIAARGIDIDLVTHVINYELPDVPESYVHRIGRTARAGASGIAISLVDGDERGQLRDIERTTRQTIPSESRRGDMALTADRAPARPAGGRPGIRPAARPDARGDGRPERGRHEVRGGAPGGSNGYRGDRNDRAPRDDRNGGGGGGQRSFGAPGGAPRGGAGAPRGNGGHRPAGGGQPGRSFGGGNRGNGTAQQTRRGDR